MKALRRTWKRLLGTLGGARRDGELQTEFESHLAMQTEDNIRAGMSPREARRAAVLKFGGVESAKESYRDQRGMRLLETFVQDVRYGFGSLRHQGLSGQNSWRDSRRPASGLPRFRLHLAPPSRPPWSSTPAGSSVGS